MSNRESSSSTVSEQVFLILLSLVAGRKHGYAILKDIEATSGGAMVLSTSTLYGALGRLEREGLVGHVDASPEVAPGLPRKVYELTPRGLAVLQGEATGLSEWQRSRAAIFRGIPGRRGGGNLAMPSH